MQATGVRAVLLVALAAIACTDRSPTTGSLVITINGLPVGAPGRVSVTGPNSFSQVVEATATLENLAPGEYTVAPQTVHFNSILYSSAVTEEKHTVSAGHSESATLTYALAGGSIDLVVNGLPAGVNPHLILTDPFGFQIVVSAAGIIGELSPGQYTLRADTMTAPDGDRYGAAILQQTISVVASLTPTPATVDFTLATGRLSVVVNGLPSDLSPAPVIVTGPGQYRDSTAASRVFRGLAPGTYTISATSANGECPLVYTSAQPEQTTDVTIGATSSAVASYTTSQVSPATLNLKIDGVHVVQVTQSYVGNIPMLAGKLAMLRVFGIANQCNNVRPNVRVLVSSGATLDTVIAAPEPTVRTQPNQIVFFSTWNVMIPASLVQPGMTVTAEIDPENAIAETNESDNRFPASGSLAIDVRVLPRVGLRLVPIIQDVSNQQLTGVVNASNVNAFLDMARRIHPVAGFDVDLRAPYSTSVVLQSCATTTTCESWSTLLEELEARRKAEGSSRYYYGVVHVNYTSGVAGIGIVYDPSSCRQAASCRAALGWDNFGGTFPAHLVLAHELGHNYGRRHAPCGNPANVDPDYPYPGGLIGKYGFDIADLTIKPPDFHTDIMGYCGPQWISDYNYFFMMQRLSDPSHGPSQPVMATAQEEPSLLLWGRVVNGVPLLEPAFEISAIPDPPTGSGPNRLSATDANGNELFAFSFTGNQVADLPGRTETFAFAVPIALLNGRALASLKLTAQGRTVSSSATGGITAESRTTLSRIGSRAMRLRWNAAKFPVVMVRDPEDGTVLSFARGGDATIVTGRSDLELNYSNRVNSTRRRVLAK